MRDRLLKLTRWMSRTIGRRGSVLMILGLVDMGIATSIFTVPLQIRTQGAYQILQAFLPLWIWGSLFALSGGASIVQAFWKRDAFAYVTSATVKALFGFQYLFAWMYGGVERAWINGILFFLLSVLMVVISGWSEVTTILISPKSDDAIVSADSSGRITFWNRSAEAMFGWNSDEIIGSSVSVLMPERYKKNHEEGLKRVREHGASKMSGRIVRAEAVRKDGTEFKVELVVSVSGTGDDMALGGVIRSLER